MQFRGIFPSAVFLLVLVGTLLFLLSRELGFFGRGSHPVAPGHWVFLTDPEFGSSFHSFRVGQALGPLVAMELPRLSHLLDERCRQIALEAGTEIRFYSEPGTKERSCVVFPLSEQCRYLLGMPLNVNRAGEEELKLLPGIGPKLAGRILEVRESVGGFSSAEELLRVPGIGKKLLQKMQGRMCFDTGRCTHR